MVAFHAIEVQTFAGPHRNDDHDRRRAIFAIPNADQPELGSLLQATSK
jgi:hypothetical protein